MADKDTFVRVTNRNIYDAIQAGTKQNAEEHAEIVLHQQRTNGRVKTNRWIATTALTIAFTGIGWALSLV